MQILWKTNFACLSNYIRIHPLYMPLTLDTAIPRLTIWPKGTLAFTEIIFQFSPSSVQFNKIQDTTRHTSFWNFPVVFPGRRVVVCVPSMTGGLLIALLFPDATFGHLTYSVAEKCLAPYIMRCSLTLGLCLTPTKMLAF